MARFQGVFRGDFGFWHHRYLPLWPYGTAIIPSDQALSHASKSLGSIEDSLASAHRPNILDAAAIMSNADIYISVDIEASGPFPPEYSMLSIGACVVGDIETSFYEELKPISKQFLHKAIKVVGKPMEHFTDSGNDPKIVMERLDEWIKSISGGQRPVFVGFNAAFDWAFINWYFHTYSGKNPFGIAPIDIKSLFMGLEGVPWKDTRSSRIPDQFKGPLKQTHHALEDAKAQAQMFERVLRCAQERRKKTESPDG